MAHLFSETGHMNVQLFFFFVLLKGSYNAHFPQVDIIL